MTWPTAERINAWIAYAAQANQHASPLAAMGAQFLELGKTYEINPAGVLAIVQRETHCGADGAFLPTQCNNFGNLTGSGDAGTVWYQDRYWAKFTSPGAGLAAVFERLTQPAYAATDGTMGGLMAVYAPPVENDWQDMFDTFGVVGDFLGIPITRETMIREAEDMADIVYGKVPKPAVVNRYIPDFGGMAAGWYGKRMVLGVVWHRMVGNLLGSDDYFRTPGTGLTDYGIGVGGWDASNLDGVVYQWNDPLGVRSGWASGSVTQPYGDGLAFVNEFAPTYGVDIVNRGQVSIEVSGNYTTPLTTASRAKLVALTAYYADQAKIPWDQFPNWPGHGYSFVRWHQEFTGPALKVCPGDVVMGETATLLAAVAAHMKKYQLDTAMPAPVVYLPPIVPDWLTADISAGVMRDRDWNGYHVWGVERQYRALRDTPRYQTAELGSDRFTGPKISAGDVFKGSHIFGSGTDQWVMTPYGTRVYARDLTPSIIIASRAA